MFQHPDQLLEHEFQDIAVERVSFHQVQDQDDEPLELNIDGLPTALQVQDSIVRVGKLIHHSLHVLVTDLLCR